jgi:hypothetical protein
MGFRLVHELSYLTKKIFNIFLIRVPPFHQKNGKKIFHHDITIHTPIESPYRVYLKHAVLRNIYFEIRN